MTTIRPPSGTPVAGKMTNPVGFASLFFSDYIVARFLLDADLSPDVSSE
jgi:hypothetical protein